MSEMLMAVKNLSVQKNHDRYGVYVSGNMVDSFAHYKEATKLLIDLSLSRTAASEDVNIGSIVYYDQVMGPQASAVVVAKADDGKYWIQPTGTSSKERFSIAASALTGTLES